MGRGKSVGYTAKVYHTRQKCRVQKRRAGQKCYDKGVVTKVLWSKVYVKGVCQKCMSKGVPRATPLDHATLLPWLTLLDQGIVVCGEGLTGRETEGLTGLVCRRTVACCGVQGRNETRSTPPYAMPQAPRSCCGKVASCGMVSGHSHCQVCVIVAYLSSVCHCGILVA